MVQVHHDEGVANRIDPESCADAREGIGEALTGERIGQPLSRDSTLILGADVVPVTEGNTDGRDNNGRIDGRSIGLGWPASIARSSPNRVRYVRPVRWSTAWRAVCCRSRSASSVSMRAASLSR